MNLKNSPSDVNTVAPFCREVYRRCKDVGGDFDDIGRDVHALHDALKHLKYEFDDTESPLNRDHALWGRKIVPVLGDSNSTLLQLNDHLQIYERNCSNDSVSSSPTRPGVQRGVTRTNIIVKDQLIALKAKLLSHKTSLTLFLDTIQLHSSNSNMAVLKGQPEQLDTILDKVDKIAVKLRNRIHAADGEGDGKALWKQFRDELVAEGFSYGILQHHKDVLRAYIREIDQEGQSNKTPTSPVEPFPSFKHDKSETPQSASSSSEIPKSLELLNLHETTHNLEIKPGAEAGLKFPQLMREHMLRAKDGKLPAPLQIPTTVHSSSDYYTLITPDMFSDDLLYATGHGSPSETYITKSNRIKPVQSEVIETSDLMATTLPAQLSPSPTQSAEKSSYFDNQDGQKASKLQSKGSKLPEQGFDATPLTERNRNAYEKHKSGKKKGRLAPDSHGQPIPADAKWTKIRRSLVSPEVLRQEGLRYEANPEHVAVLGQLSRDEIQDYAARSLALREARWARPRPQVPRAYTYQVPRPSPNTIASQWNAQQVPRSDPNSDSEAEREQNIKDARNAFLRTRQTCSPQRRTSYQPQSGYPNPYGSPIQSRFPSSMSTPTSAAPRSPNLKPALPTLGDRSASSINLNKTRAASAPSVTFAEEVTVSTMDDIDKSRETPNKKESEGQERGLKRWKARYKEQGIGGTAISLMNVLSDAAGI